LGKQRRILQFYHIKTLLNTYTQIINREPAMRQVTRSTNPDNTYIGSRLGRFGDEEERASTRAIVTESQGLKAIIQAWQDYDFSIMYKTIKGRINDQNYQNAQTVVADIDYDAHDVEQFSIALIDMVDEREWAGWLGEKLGIFLSALINSGKDDDYEIHTKDLGSINYLGYCNRKRITVHGDLGEHLGEYMECGSITVKGDVKPGSIGAAMRSGEILIEGDAGSFIGELMAGGSITIEGNAKGEIGEYMREGKITVKGNADGCRIGTGMSGGEIEIHGNVRDEAGSFMSGGSILVKGDVRITAGEGMTGGLIVVDGNAGDLVGQGMSGGKIIVNNAGRDIGYNMKGGQIHIYGDYGSISILRSFRLWARIKVDYKKLESDVKAGKIYHKGELIVDR
jgi:formylmethanofuran dehydrogenase subunit C